MNSHEQQSSSDATASTLTFRVDDMACGHCAGAIKAAIETTLSGTTVTADPGSKRVHVVGSDDFAAISAAVTKAGYTPGAAPLAA
jgi:copper chaperone